MKESMQNAIFISKGIDKNRAGQANVKMLDGVQDDYYGV
jgi:ribosome recycling factor